MSVTTKIESKYLERFKRLTDNPTLCSLRGDRLIVEVLPKQELKSAGGIVLAAPTNQVKSMTADGGQPTLAVVLAVGDGFVSSDGTPEDLPVKPGAIVLVAELGLKHFSVYPGVPSYTANTIALTRLEEVHAFWDSSEEFAAYCSLLA